MELNYYDYEYWKSPALPDLIEDEGNKNSKIENIKSTTTNENYDYNLHDDIFIHKNIDFSCSKKINNLYYEKKFNIYDNYTSNTYNLNKYDEDNEKKLFLNLNLLNDDCDDENRVVIEDGGGGVDDVFLAADDDDDVVAVTNVLTNTTEIISKTQIQMNNTNTNTGNSNNLNIVNATNFNFLSTTTPCNNNIITTTRFLHLSNSSNISSSSNSKKFNSVNSINSGGANINSTNSESDEVNNNNNNEFLVPTTPTTTACVSQTIKLDNLITLTPTIMSSLNSDTNANSVVSRIKNWIGMRKSRMSETSNSSLSPTASTNAIDSIKCDANANKISLPDAIRITTPNTTTTTTVFTKDTDLTSSSTSPIQSASKATKLDDTVKPVASDLLNTPLSATSSTSSSSSSVKMPSQLLLLLTATAYNPPPNITNTTSLSSSLSSISDKRLKRPIQVPNNIEYHNSQIFQGSLFLLYLFSFFKKFNLMNFNLNFKEIY